MKNTLLSFIIITFLGLNACSPNILTQTSYSGEVNADNIKTTYEVRDGRGSYATSKIPWTEGTVRVISKGYGQKYNDADHNAKASAFYILLFRGLPGSDYKLPLIADEEGKKDDSFVKSILEGAYTTYITSSQMVGGGREGRKNRSSTFKLTINYDALRRSLEEKKIISKF